jgi:putative kinase
MISLDLTLDGVVKQIKLAEEQLTDVYLPLINWMLSLQQALDRRILIGLAGPPGCGKTYFSHVLSTLINQKKACPYSVVVGMDGWHYPNEYLEEKIIQINGKSRVLKSLKGVPESFNVVAFLDILSNIRQAEELHYPCYDRTIHEPVENRGILTSDNKLVLLEGNYLLLDEHPWCQISAMLDGRCFLWAGDLLRWQTLMQRHLNGGKTAVQALHHIRTVDMVNARRIGRPDADVQLQRIAKNELAILSEFK